MGSGFGGIGNTTVADNFARHCRLVADNPYVILPSSKGWELNAPVSSELRGRENRFVEIPPAFRLSLVREKERERALRERISKIRKEILRAQQKCPAEQASCPPITVGESTEGSKTSVGHIGLAFDTSWSMLFPASLSLEDEKKALKKKAPFQIILTNKSLTSEGVKNLSAKEMLELILSRKSIGERTRIGLALQALKKFVDDVPDSIKIGLILSDPSSPANKCAVRDIRFLDASEKGTMENSIISSRVLKWQ